MIRFVQCSGSYDWCLGLCTFGVLMSALKRARVSESEGAESGSGLSSSAVSGGECGSSSSRSAVSGALSVLGTSSSGASGGVKLLELTPKQRDAFSFRQIRKLSFDEHARVQWSLPRLPVVWGPSDSTEEVVQRVVADIPDFQAYNQFRVRYFRLVRFGESYLAAMWGKRVEYHFHTERSGFFEPSGVESASRARYVDGEGGSFTMILHAYRADVPDRMHRGIEFTVRLGGRSIGELLENECDVMTEVETGIRVLETSIYVHDEDAGRPKKWVHKFVRSRYKLLPAVRARAWRECRKMGVPLSGSMFKGVDMCPERRRFYGNKCGVESKSWLLHNLRGPAVVRALREGSGGPLRVVRVMFYIRADLFTNRSAWDSCRVLYDPGLSVDGRLERLEQMLVLFGDKLDLFMSELSHPNPRNPHGVSISVGSAAPTSRRESVEQGGGASADAAAPSSEDGIEDEIGLD